MDFIKIKNFCSSNETGKRIKTQATDWEKIFAKYTFDTWLTSGIYKEVSKFNNKNVNNPILKIGQKIQHKHMKRCST